MKRRMLRRFVAYLHATGAMSLDLSPQAADEVVQEFLRSESRNV